MTTAPHPPGRSPALMATGGLGLLWGLSGLFPLIQSVTATREGLLAKGLTPDQAAIMTGYPAWITLTFAVGILGGIAGCILLLLRRKSAVAVLGASLAGNLLTTLGYSASGVFAALGSQQVYLMSTVVIISIALFAAALGWSKNGRLL